MLCLWKRWRQELELLPCECRVAWVLKQMYRCISFSTPLTTQLRVQEGEEAEAESGDENAPQPQELTRATGKVRRGRKGTRPQALTSTLQENLMSPTL